MLDPEAPLDVPPRGSFLASVNVVLITYGFDAILALITGAIIARALGPDGRGAYALFVLSISFGQLLLGFGAGNAAIYYLNRKEMALRDVVTGMHVIVLASLVASAVVVAAIVPFAGEDLLGDGVPAWLFVVAVPVLLYLSLMRLTLQALSRFIELGFATIGHQLAVMSSIALLVAIGDPTPGQVVGCLVGASALAGLFVLVRIGISNVDIARIVRPHWATLRALATFGVKGEAGNILQLLNYRLDQYIVRGFVGLAGVGVYAVSASLTEGVFMLANAVALVLMPRLTSSDEETVLWMTPVATRNTIVIAAGGSLALAAIAPIAIPAIFGHAYDDAVRALWLLLPGAVALTGSKVLTSYIFSQGRPFVNTMVTAASLVVTLIALLVLVPAYGINGAAVASSLAYATHFAAALYAYHRISGQPALDAVIPRASDIHLYTDTLRLGLDRIRGRRASDADARPAATPRSGG